MTEAVVGISVNCSMSGPSEIRKSVGVCLVTVLDNPSLGVGLGPASNPPDSSNEEAAQAILLVPVLVSQTTRCF